MKQYDVKCPVCGKINHGLFLEETKGWMEFELCGADVEATIQPEGNAIPFLTAELCKKSIAYGAKIAG